MPLPQLNETLGISRAAHLLHRATFGASKTTIDNFASMTPAQAVSELFLNDLPDASLPIDPQTGAEWVTTGASASSGDELVAYFERWFLGQMMGVDVTPAIKMAYTAREKVTLFLHTHFTTRDEVVTSSRALYFQNALFRLFAFDKEDRLVEITDPETEITTTEIAPANFKELTKKICVDNAMLIFLDGRQNVRGNPNENYAREMFELYTIGRGLESEVDGKVPDEDGDYFLFKELDVQAAARVLTGFKFDENFQTIDPYTGLPRGRADVGAHTTDATQKTFSEYFDNTVIDQDPELTNGTQPTEESMLDEISQLIDMIYEKEETAKQICRKIYRFYVYHEITKELDDTVIVEMANTFASNNYKIQPVIEELLGSQHFYNNASAGVTDDKFGAIIKSPIDLITGTLNFFEAQLPSMETNLDEFYSVAGKLLSQSKDQGMDFYNPFEVAGYGAYFQYPRYNRNWISSNYLANRYDFVNELINKAERMPNVDALTYIKDNFNGVAGNGKQLILAMAPYIFPFTNNLDFEVDGGDITKERLRYFLQIFLGFGDYNNTTDVDEKNNIWNNLYTTPASYLEAGNYANRLFNVLMQSPEYQLF